jgi:hypothetical protein
MHDAAAAERRELDPADELHAARLGACVGLIQPVGCIVIRQGGDADARVRDRIDDAGWAELPIAAVAMEMEIAEKLRYVPNRRCRR